MQDAVPVILYSRSEHGQVPVKILDTPGDSSGSHPTRIYEIETAEGASRFDSARQLLIALTGHPEARHWTFDRYFRVGKYGTDTGAEVLTVLDPFVPRSDDGTVVVAGEFVTVTKKVCHGDKLSTEVCHGEEKVCHGDKVLAESLPPCQTSPESLSPCQTLGIDLKARGHEVAKLLFAGFGSYIYSQGYDPDDVLQEVYRGILVRNQGTCPWDARKSSFGHYVHLVCGCVLSNYHRRQGRRRGREVSWSPESGDLSDGRPAPAGRDPEQELAQYLGKLSGRDQDAQLALRILPLVTQGYDRGEIAERLGLPRGTVARGITTLRQATRLWSTRR
jgi:DNA-directed RNA polymerase specialized sigma24 family protein